LNNNRQKAKKTRNKNLLKYFVGVFKSVLWYVFRVKITACVPLQWAFERIIILVNNFLKTRKFFELNFCQQKAAKMLKTISTHTTVLFF
jgi:hypothetical protein